MLPSGVLTTRYESDIAILRTKTQWLLLLMGLTFLLLIPLYASPYWLSWLTGLATTIVAVLGLHVLTGLCGLFSIGHAAFLGVGAYTVAVLTNSFGLNGWLCLPICGLSAGVAGVFFGLPCFRLKGFYLAISTLAASFIIVWCMRYAGFEEWTGGFNGLTLARLKLGGIDFTSKGTLYLVAVGLMVLCTFFVRNIQRTRTGRALVAIRDNELAAEVSGIRTFQYKMTAFFIGCFLAGIAGWLWAYSLRNVNAAQFRLDDSIWFVGMLIIGGMGSTTGAFLGAVSFKGLQRLIDLVTPMLEDMVPASMALQLHVAMSLGVFSIVLLIFLILEPRGLYYRLEKFKTY